jgi:hypothetical protein
MTAPILDDTDGDAIVCVTCSAPDLRPDDVCHHRNPICLRCCAAGEHGWDPMPWESYDDGDAA